jgi:N-acetylmuramoyl-L-alanine amidase
VNGAMIVENHLPYVSRLETRPEGVLDLVVVHCTELPDLATARDYAQRIHYPESKTGNSGHFYIERNGGTEEWVPANRVAHHVRGHNGRSIGIELVNTGRFPDWLDSRKQVMPELYPSAQISSLVRLLLHLSDKHTSLEWIAGHEDLDRLKVPATDKPERLVQRKMDPGPNFPWTTVLAQVALKRLLPE